MTPSKVSPAEWATMNQGGTPPASSAASIEPAEVPTITSALAGSQPVSSATASSAPTSQAPPWTPPAPRTSPTFIAGTLTAAAAAVRGATPARRPPGRENPAAGRVRSTPPYPYPSLASKAYKQDGLLIITFDQAHPAADVAEADQVGTLLLSPLAPKGASLGTPYDPYSVQRSTAELLGVTPLAKGARTESFASQLLGGGD